jgi:hypothetical protein
LSTQVAALAPPTQAKLAATTIPAASPIKVRLTALIDMSLGARDGGAT